MSPAKNTTEPERPRREGTTKRGRESRGVTPQPTRPSRRPPEEGRRASPNTEEQHRPSSTRRAHARQRTRPEGSSEARTNRCHAGRITCNFAKLRQQQVESLLKHYDIDMILDMVAVALHDLFCTTFSTLPTCTAGTQMP